MKEHEHASTRHRGLCVCAKKKKKKACDGYAQKEWKTKEYYEISTKVNNKMRSRVMKDESHSCITNDDWHGRS